MPTAAISERVATGRVADAIESAAEADGGRRTSRSRRAWHDEIYRDEDRSPCRGDEMFDKTLPARRSCHRVPTLRLGCQGV